MFREEAVFMWWLMLGPLVLGLLLTFFGPVVVDTVDSARATATAASSASPTPSPQSTGSL